MDEKTLELMEKMQKDLLDVIQVNKNMLGIKGETTESDEDSHLREKSFAETMASECSYYLTINL